MSTVSEEDRHDMANSLEQHLGRRTAMTLLQHLPPVGWGDVATVRDIEALEARVDAKLAVLQASMQRWFIATLLTFIGTMITLTGVIAAAAFALR